MRNYEIFLIKDDVAKMYHGIEKKLFQLFQENKRSKGFLKRVTDHQIAYITRGIRTGELNNYIYEKLFYNADYSYDAGMHHVRAGNMRSEAVMWVKEDRIYVEAEGQLDTEAIFFEVLRGYELYFLAVNSRWDQYGWLKPMKMINAMHK